jgi:hypothetical protein
VGRDLEVGLGRPVPLPAVPQRAIPKRMWRNAPSRPPGGRQRSLPVASRVVLLVLSLVVAVPVCANNVTRTVHADSLSADQAKLKAILKQRNYWVQRLKAARAQQDMLHGKLGHTQTQADNKSTALAKIQAQFAAQKAALDQTIAWDEQRIDAVKAHLLANRATSKQIRARRATMLARLAGLRLTIKRQVGHVRAAVIQMYDLSQVPPIEQILQAKSITDLLQQQNFVAEVGQRDAAILTKARRERLAVHRLAAGCLKRLRELKRLHRKKRAELKLVKSQTVREGKVLEEDRAISLQKQESVEAARQQVQRLSSVEGQQAGNVQVMINFDTKRVEHELIAAETVAVSMAEQTGHFPHIGGANIFRWGKLTHWEGAGPEWCSQFGGYPLGAAFHHIYACGPSTGEATPFDMIGFQCVELSARYMWAVNGDYVANVPTGEAFVQSAHDQFGIPVGVAGVHSFPLPGDVVSISGGETTRGIGHTAIVVSAKINSHGDGLIHIVQQNASSNGWGVITVSNWQESFGGPAEVTWLKLFGRPAAANS